VKYASERHITIIPEIELPVHSVAAIAAYPWLSCTGDTIPVENEWGVFKDIYCAGSEHELQTYFIERVAKYLETKNKKIIGWDDILGGGVP